MTRTPSRSSTFLTGLCTLLLVLSIGFGLLIAVGAIFGFGPGGDDVAVHATVEAEHLAGLPPGTVDDQIEVVVRVADPDVEQIRWFAVRDLPSGILVIVILWLVRGLLRSVRDGSPFIKDNVARLRSLASLVLVGIPIAESLRSIFAGELADTVGLVGPPLHVLSGNALLGGLAILVLSEVFAEGIRLHDDLDGTV
jgi:hypothetical protein